VVAVGAGVDDGARVAVGSAVATAVAVEGGVVGAVVGGREVGVGVGLLQPASKASKTRDIRIRLNVIDPPMEKPMHRFSRLHYKRNLRIPSFIL